MATSTPTIARPSAPLTMTDDEFVAFYEKRPHGERWQLIDGEVVMMNPPKLRHQVVAGTLARRLNNHFEAAALSLLAIQEAGLLVPGVTRFRPTADLAVVDRSVDLSLVWSDRFQLAADIVSESNTPGQIERKRKRYMQHPENQYVLVIEQEAAEVEVWARRRDWKPFALRGLDAMLELPEFDFTITLRSISADTKVGRD